MLTAKEASRRAYDVRHNSIVELKQGYKDTYDIFLGNLFGIINNKIALGNNSVQVKLASVRYEFKERLIKELEQLGYDVSIEKQFLYIGWFVPLAESTEEMTQVVTKAEYKADIRRLENEIEGLKQGLLDIFSGLKDDVEFQLSGNDFEPEIDIDSEIRELTPDDL